MQKAKGIGIDLETTDFEPANGHIVEFGLIAFDENFEEIDSLEVLVNDRGWKSISEVEGSQGAIGMHTKSGLMQLVIDEGQPMWQAEMAVLDFITKHSDGQRFPLMGSSVHFDRSWMQHHTPNVMKKFSHRNMDASANYEATAVMDSGLSGFFKMKLRAAVDKELTGDDHRALYDIRKSLSYWRQYKEVFTEFYQSHTSI